MNSGLYALARASATATAAACAKRLLEPITNVSKVYLGLSRAWVGRGVPPPGPGPAWFPASRRSRAPAGSNDQRTATFMILGNVCTRRCGFCAVQKGAPLPVDYDEPNRVAEAVEAMGLKFAVITSVNRDDREDGGAALFALVIRAIRARVAGCGVEVLVPDFQGSLAAVATVMEAAPEVFNHNTETVPRLYRQVRLGARYER